MGRTPRLPPELTDVIIDYMHHDKEALKQCSLVCKSWERSSTLHLFSSWTWPVHARQSATRGLLEIPGRAHEYHPSHDDLSSCVQVLSDTARFNSFVQHLTISDPSGSRGRYHSWDDGYSYTTTNEAADPACEELLLRILDLLPALRTLHCRDFHFSPLHPFLPPEQRMRRLSEARLIRCGQHVLDIGVFLSLFSHIDTLIISGKPTAARGVNASQNAHLISVGTL